VSAHRKKTNEKEVLLKRLRELDEKLLIGRPVRRHSSQLQRLCAIRHRYGIEGSRIPKMRICDVAKILGFSHQRLAYLFRRYEAGG